MPPHPRFLSVCLNPALQETVVLERLREDEVNRSSEYRQDASGKGINVTRVLTQLGERATLLTQAGGRSRARFLSLAEQDGLCVTWVDSGSEIRTCTTLLNREQATCTEIVQEAVAVAPATESRVREAYARLLPEHSVVIFSGTKAPGFSDGLYPALVEQAKLVGATVVLDVSGADLRACLEHAPDVVKPNFAEFSATFVTDGMPSEHARDADLEQRVREQMSAVAGRYGCAVVLTHGTQPTLFVEPGGGEPSRSGTGEVMGIAVEPIRPLNSIGSGDAFTAGLARALAHGAELREAVRQGHECGQKNAALIRPGVIR
jgi:tagatose 6-phosphate kinase